MLKLKEFFAFPMFATALWLLWVFSLQTSVDALIELLLVLLLISLLVWLMANTSTKIMRIILLLALGSLLVQIQSLASVKVSVSDSKDRQDVTIWTKEIEQELQAQDKPYLINYTAAWCITCQAMIRLLCLDQ